MQGSLCLLSFELRCGASRLPACTMGRREPRHTSRQLPAAVARPPPSRRCRNSMAASAAAVPTPQLVRSALVLHACASPSIVLHAARLLQRAAASNSPLAQPALLAARHTIFTHFAAGETLHDVRAVAARLGAAGVRCIVDHATEESTEASARAHNLERKLALLAELRAELPAAAAFVPVKLTALVDPAALERATASPSDADALLAEGVAQCRPLCEAARAASIPLLLDAEQTPRQPAIMRIARALSAEFNPRGAAPTLYNTHQMYLRGARATLDEEAAHAAEAGYVLAVKLVRGAYMQTEPAAALQPSKGATDDAYDGAAALLLERVADGGGALLLATHNRRSLQKLGERMAELGLARDDPAVHAAQILGMADDATYGLGAAGYNALKLVPYGAFDELLPWLLRRLEENSSILGAAAEERPLLRRELRRRVLG